MKIHEEPKCVSLSKRSQPAKATYCVTPIVGHSRKQQTMEIAKATIVVRV